MELLKHQLEPFENLHHRLAKGFIEVRPCCTCPWWVPLLPCPCSLLLPECTTRIALLDLLEIHCNRPPGPAFQGRLTKPASACQVAARLAREQAGRVPLPPMQLRVKARWGFRT